MDFSTGADMNGAAAKLACEQIVARLRAFGAAVDALFTDPIAVAETPPPGSVVGPAVTPESESESEPAPVGSTLPLLLSAPVSSPPSVSPPVSPSVSSTPVPSYPTRTVSPPMSTS